MNQISNQSVATLAEILHRQLLENGFAASAMERADRYAKYLSGFMEKNDLQVYDESIGIDFLNNLQPHFSTVTNQNLRLFIARINAILKKESFVTHVKMSELVVLPDPLEQLVTHYKKHCLEKGLRSSTIKIYEAQCRAFLNSLADIGVCDCSSITAASISTACLRQLNCSDFSSIRTFLKFLFEAKYLVKDFTSVIPRFRHPQPMPSVYSVPEVQQIEEKTNCDTSFGKRNYAMLLLATRLGIRAGDIVTMTFDELDFQSETIHMIQNKTGAPLELPMPPSVRNALVDYIQNYRGNSTSKYVFLSLYPPFSAITVTAFGRYMRLALKDAGIEPGHRRSGPHSMRSSLASSMINDNISYEAVRRTLGHTGVNAIKSYAKLDIEQLKLYTLEPPEASGHFAEVISGRYPVK